MQKVWEYFRLTEGDVANYVFFIDSRSNSLVQTFRCSLLDAKRGGLFLKRPKIFGEKKEVAVLDYKEETSDKMVVARAGCPCHWDVKGKAFG